MNYSVTLDGFKNKEQALEFLHWYCEGGEQQFGDHLSIVGKSGDDGCYIDVQKKGNSDRYWSENGNNISAKVK